MVNYNYTDTELKEDHQQRDQKSRRGRELNAQRKKQR